MNAPARRVRKIAGLLTGLLVLGSGLAAAQPAQAAAGPSGLTAAAVATKGVRLTWSGSADGLYRVRFARSSSMSNAVSWTVVGNQIDWTRTVGDPSAAGSRLSPGASYYFQVKRIIARKESVSDYSKAVKVTLPSSGKQELPPTQVKATPAGAGALHLSWSSAGPGVRYRVRFTDKASLPVTKWRYADFTSAGGQLSGLQAGRPYRIKVRVISTAKAALSNYSPTLNAAAPTSGSRSVKMMSYNITKTGTGPSWTSRRSAVAATIAAQQPAILGLQEAVPLTVKGITGTTVPQYTDVLNLIGKKYDWVTTKGSSGTRLAYDTTRFKVVEAGSKALTTLGTATRYAVWARLSDRTNSDQVFVVNTHLEPGDPTEPVNQARATQAAEILALIQAENRSGVPAVVLGDMNSSRSTVPNLPYQVLTEALVDPVGNAADTWLFTSPGLAEHRVDLEYRSYNKWLPTVLRNSCPVGTRIDWFVVSPGLRVAEARTVVNVDTAGRFVGTIPSDHNAVTLTVHLS